MKFHILTLFPNLIQPYFEDSILKRAIKKDIIKINLINIRDFAKDSHKTVDDKPYGGGPGMILKIEPIFYAISSILGKNFYKNLSNLKRQGKYIILLSAKGNEFSQKKAKEFSKLKELVIICGRYEGVDERVKENLVHEEISIGKYILSGGELPALVIIEATSRLIKGVLGNVESLKYESFSGKIKKEYPQYTRPEVFVPEAGIYWKVPKILLSGDHKKIEKWREKFL